MAYFGRFVLFLSTLAQAAPVVPPAEVRVGLPIFPASPLYYLADDEPSLAFNTYVFEPLITRDPHTGDWKPRLAKRWSWSKDHRTLTVHLDPNARFSDGHPVTAEDVVFTTQLLRNPKHLAAPFRNRLEIFDTIQTSHPLTVQAHTVRPQFRALEDLGTLFVLPKHIWEKVDFNRSPHSAVIGSGPYRMSEFVPGTRVTLERDPRYWNHKAAERSGEYFLPKIHFLHLPDPGTAAAALKKGDLDYLYVTTAKIWAEDLKPSALPPEARRLEAKSQRSSGTQAIYWNLRRPLFKDVRVRRALAQLLPREQLIQSLFYDQYGLATGIFHHRSAFHAPDNRPIAYEPTEAQSALDAAGCPRLEGKLRHCQGVAMRFTVISATPGSERFLTVYRESLQNAGIEMQIRPLEWSKLSEAVDRHEFDAVEMTRSREVDPSEFADWTGGERNPIGFSDPRVEKEVHSLAPIFDRKRRTASLQKIDRWIAEAAPAAFLWEPDYLRIAYRDRFEFHSPGYAPYDRWFEIFARWRLRQ